MSRDTEEKWGCEICTFKNWPSSVKCTMCCTKRPLVGEDIYKLQKGEEERQDNRHSSGARAITPEIAWQCSLCTYLNSEVAGMCIQCDTPRKHKPSPTLEHLDTTRLIYKNQTLNDKIDYGRESSRISKSNSQTLNVSKGENLSLKKSNSHNTVSERIVEKDSETEVNLLLDDVGKCAKGGSKCDKGTSASPGSPENKKNNRNRQNVKQIVSESSKGSSKWVCQQCTYENWPKAVKCVMCGLCMNPKPSAVDSPEIDSARGLPHDDSTNCGVRRSSSRRLDTSDSERSTQHSPNNCEYERRLRLRRQADRSWLEACMGVVDGDPNPVEAYLNSGGNPARYLTPSEIALLNRPSAFDAGHTLVHLAIRFHREDMLATLLSQIEGSGPGVKRVPSYVAPDLAADIRRHVSSSLRQRKGSFPCYFVTEITTFALPAEVEDLQTPVQDQLFDELLDREVQTQLETDPPVLNWSLEITVRLGSRLYALWNRSAGDCLLDSVMQATWGVFDRENVLRRALADSLHQGGHLFYPRWREYESLQASLLQFSMDEAQYQDDWAGLLSLASQPGSSLDQLHVFALSHILRRPIIVYGVKYVKSFRGEALGLARFEGVYLPLLWEPSFCARSPLALGYTRGHFSALVALEPYSHLDQLDLKTLSNKPRHNLENNSDHLQVTFLPLMDRDRKMLPVHFLTHSEMGREDTILRQWLDVCVTEGGITVAQQKLHKRPLLVAQMLEEWLNHYRRLEQMTQAPFSTRQVPAQDYSSEGETDDE